MATDEMIAVDSAAFEFAARLCARARNAAFDLPERIPVAAHDTHAAGLDAELDTFADQAQAAAGALITRIAIQTTLLELAADGFSAVELAIARAVAR